jgi:hypothetical protein
MIALEPEGIVHIRVFRMDKAQPVAVQHLPILASCLGPDVAWESDVAPVPKESWPAVLAWRQDREAGNAGAFSVSLAKSLELILKTVAEAGNEFDFSKSVIETAYPVRGSDGSFSTIKAVSRDLSPESARQGV